MHDRPLAAAGLKSYRYKTAYGYTMIGAHTHAEALSEASRGLSSGKRAQLAWLDVWDGEKYVPALYNEGAPA